MVRSLIQHAGAVRLAGLGGLLAAVAACAPLTPVRGSGPNGKVEAIYGAAVAGDVAVVRVVSNGCTTKDDMFPDVSRGAGQAVLTVRRLRPDRCEAPDLDGVELRWTFEELGLEPGTSVHVGNPFLSSPELTIGGLR